MSVKRLLPVHGAAGYAELPAVVRRGQDDLATRAITGMATGPGCGRRARR